MNETEFESGVIRPVECYREAWELIKPNYWLLFAITLLGMMIGGISFYVLLGAMLCGIYYCYFRALEGEAVSVEHLFRGLDYFLPSLFVTVLIIVPMIILFATMYLPLLLVSFSRVIPPDEMWTIFTGTLITEFVFAVVMVCLHTLLMFSYPLIVDRKLGGWRSVTVSARAVWRNLSGVAGLWAVGFVFTFIGSLACGVGAYFVFPVVMGGTLVAYRKVFPRIEIPDGPPPPEAYSTV